MNDFLVTLLNMSLVSCWLIIALILLRPLLKKAPGAFVCALWGLVGLRLVCPFTFESFLSLVPDAEPVRNSGIYSDISAFAGTDGGAYVLSNANDTLVPPAGTSITNPLQAISLVAAFIWAAGFAVMLIISLVSYLRLRKSVDASVNIGGNVFINDDIASPFVLGLVHPRVYLPSSLAEDEKEYVIAHENAHIKRRDYLIKPLGYVILSLHWFNPLVWVAYMLLCRDIESACDERVIKEMSDEGKIEYSRILLRLSIPNKSLRACPVAFGEVGVKARIKSVLNYKKPAFWIVVVAVVLTAALTVGFLTNPVSENSNEKSDSTVQPVESSSLEITVNQAIIGANRTSMAENRYLAADYQELKTLTFGNNIITYIWSYYGEYEGTQSGVELKYDKYAPAIVRMYNDNGVYKLEDYSDADDTYGVSELKAMFPEELHSSIMYLPGYINDLKAECKRLAELQHNPDNEDYKVNEFYPVFNATVLEITDKYVTVQPFKGERVSGNSFDKVQLSTLKLTTDLSEINVGDNVQVRYSDIITIETDPPTLLTVFHITKLETKSQSLELAAVYLAVKSSDENNEVAEDISTADLLHFPGFILDGSNSTYTLYYVDYSNSESNSDATLTQSSGEYYFDIEYGELVFMPYDNKTDIFSFYLEGDTYRYSAERSAEYGGSNTDAIEDNLVFARALD